jgi:hypothetical protein
MSFNIRPCFFKQGKLNAKGGIESAKPKKSVYQLLARVKKIYRIEKDT